MGSHTAHACDGCGWKLPWACRLTGTHRVGRGRDDMQLWVMQPVQVHAELVPHPSDVDPAHLVSVRVHHPAAAAPPVVCPILNVVVDAVRVESTWRNTRSLPTPLAAAAFSEAAVAAAPAPLTPVTLFPATPASSSTTLLTRLLSDPLLPSSFSLPSSLPSSLHSSPVALVSAQQQLLPRTPCSAAPAAVRLRTGDSVCYTLQPTWRRSLEPPERSSPITAAQQPPAAAPATRETLMPGAAAAPKSRVEYSIVVECSVSEHSGATDDKGDDRAPSSVSVATPGYVRLTHLNRPR